MKLFKKIAVLGVTACLAAGVTALAACNDKNSGQLSDSQWTARLSINVESIKNGTFKTKVYNTYPKEQAAEYGEWRTDTSTYYLDLENEVMYEISESETYDETNDPSDLFDKSKHEEYLFRYNGNYYRWSKTTDHTDQAATVYKITKSDFINATEIIANQFAILSIYSDPMYKSMFKYNKDTQSYDLFQFGTTSDSIKFLDDGVRLISYSTSILAAETEYSAIDKTSVSVPASVKADVDAFIAAQQEST